VSGRKLFAEFQPKGEKAMRLIKDAWGFVSENRTAYIIINVVYYGLVIVFMIVAAFNQPLQEMLLKSVGQAYTTGVMSALGAAYLNAEMLKAISLTFVVNLVVGAFLTITVPSVIVPFIGLLMGLYRAIMWGLILSPANLALRLIMIPHSITLLIEGQGYILALLAVYIQGRTFLWPKTAGVEGHVHGYIEGIKRTGKLYILVILTLAIAAIYEVLEMVLIIKFFH
jgi:hypothetical protein